MINTSLTVPDDDYTTIGGFVFGALGRLPAVGDRVSAGRATFTVREMDGRRVESLAIDIEHARCVRRRRVAARVTESARASTACRPTPTDTRSPP